MNLKIFLFAVAAVFVQQQHSTNGQEIKQVKLNKLFSHLSKNNLNTFFLYQNLPINLTVLYKPLHHLSRTFIIESLKPLMTNINTSYLQLQLIPAGDSVINGVDNTTVQCTSPDQCTAAQFHSCALDLYFENDPILTWNFIYCTVKNKLIAGVFPAAQRCAKEELSEARWNELYQGCVVTGRGNELLAENVRKTAQLFPQGLPAVPTVLLNDQVLSKAADLDTDALKTFVCRLISAEQIQPDYCQLRIAKKIPVRVFYESTSDLSKVFFRKQTDPWCVYLEEMMSLELYPAGNVPLFGPNKTSISSDSSFGNRLLSVVNERYFNHLEQNSIDGDFMDGYMRTLVFHTCFYNASQWRGSEGVMTEQDFISAAQHCAEMSLPLDDWFNFVAAVKSKEGEEIYSKVVSYTEKFKADNGLSESGFTSIPWVTIGVETVGSPPVHSRQAANDLFLTVCSLYPLPSEGGVNRPIECTPVEVKVLYSAADTEKSADFLLNQLPEVFWRRRQRIDLTLTPYIELPLLNESLTAEEACQQNETVCTLNTAHACAVKMYFEAGDSDTVQWDGKNQTLAFISCSFEKLQENKFKNVVQIVEHCANAHFISADLLSYCSQSAEGKRYLEEMRNRTLELQNLQNQKSVLAYPLILINGEVDNGAKTDLKAAICEAIVGDKMEYCHEKDNDNDNGGGGWTPSSSPAIFFFSSFLCLIVVPLYLTF